MNDNEFLHEEHNNTGITNVSTFENCNEFLHEEHNNTGITNVSTFEIQGTIFKDILIDSAKIRKANFDLNPKHNFQTSLLKQFTNLFDTKNILYFGTMFGEEPVPIETTQGNVRIPLINKQQLINKIKKTNKPLNKFGYIHISTIQILLKRNLQEGILLIHTPQDPENKLLI
nr:movement protein [Chrysanthemum yellow edge associated virus 2]